MNTRLNCKNIVVIAIQELSESLMKCRINWNFRWSWVVIVIDEAIWWAIKVRKSLCLSTHNIIGWCHRKSDCRIESSLHRQRLDRQWNCLEQLMVVKIVQRLSHCTNNVNWNGAFGPCNLFLFPNVVCSIFVLSH